MEPNARAAFTLIELLVVVTIIVVLLALLVPALDKAIYQAELAVCGARLKFIGSSTLLYALDNKRHYPFLQGQNSSSSSEWQVIVIRQVTQAGTTDNLAMLKSYMPVNKVLNDPLNEDVDFEGSDLDTFIYSDYSLWFSWIYRGAGQKGMYKIGDRFTSKDGGVTREFDVLASDVDRVTRNNITLNSHPDDGGVLDSVARQDVAYIGSGTVGALKQTISCWSAREFNIAERGPTDMNTAFQDGSVRRYNRVKWNEYETGRMARVAENQGQQSQNEIDLWWNHLPGN